jgi:hypothetical protein
MAFVSTCLVSDTAAPVSKPAIKKGVMHISHPVALRDFFPQVRQPNIGTVAVN